MPNPQDAIKLTLTNATDTQTIYKQFNQPTTLTFTSELQPERNDFSFTVLDEPTILQQPNGDARPLLVLLKGIKIEPRGE